MSHHRPKHTCTQSRIQQAHKRTRPTYNMAIDRFRFMKGLSFMCKSLPFYVIGI